MVYTLPVLTGDAIRGRLLTSLVAFIASTGFLLFGYVSANIRVRLSICEFYANVQSHVHACRTKE